MPSLTSARSGDLCADVVEQVVVAEGPAMGGGRVRFGQPIAVIASA